MSSLFEKARSLIGNNPILQFSKKALSQRTNTLSDTTSRTAMGAGYGQEFGVPTNITHKRSIEKQRTFLNMMRFTFNQRGI